MVDDKAKRDGENIWNFYENFLMYGDNENELLWL